MGIEYFNKDTLILPCKLSLRQLEKLPDSQLLKILYHDTLAFGAYLFQNPTDDGRKGLIDIKYGFPSFLREISEDSLRKAGGDNEWSVIVAPRGFSKSTLLQMWAMKLILYRKVQNLMFVTETSDMAEEYLALVKDELELNTRIKRLFGEIKPERKYDGTDKKWNMSSIITSTRACIYALGMRKRIRGNKFLTQRPQCIIVDDPESRENTKTKEQMNKNMRWLNSDVIPALSDDGYLVATGNFIEPGCMVHRLYRNPLWQRKMYACYDADGNSIWPLKKPKEKLERKRLMLEASGDYETFWLEFMNDVKKASSKRFDPDDYRFWVGEHYSKEVQYITIELEGQYFPNSDTIDWKKIQKKRVPVRFYLGIDLAFTEKEVNDFNAFSTNAIDMDKNIYDIEHETIKTQRTSDIIDMIVEKDKQFDYEVIAIETVGAQVVVANNLKEECQRLKLKDLNRKIEEIPSHEGRKQVRILGTIQYRMKQGKHHFRCVADGDSMKVLHPELKDQYDGFPHLQHDDLIDSDEMCISFMKPPKGIGNLYISSMGSKHSLETYKEKCKNLWLIS